MQHATDEMIRLESVTKTFTMHLRDSARLPVVCNVTFGVGRGECVALGGPSGAGKSSILKMIYGNYLADSGRIGLNGPEGWIDVASAPPRAILALRATTIGYVSQFLRAIPRVGALDIVASAATPTGRPDDSAYRTARELLARLNVPERLWSLPPATFSGGEQQRVNIARGFAASHPILLLDEPTASLDLANREAVVALATARKRAGAAVLGIFHDDEVRARIADRVIDVTTFASKA